jgi:hypothetical protein
VAIDAGTRGVVTKFKDYDLHLFLHCQGIFFSSQDSDGVFRMKKRYHAEQPTTNINRHLKIGNIHIVEMVIIFAGLCLELACYLTPEIPWEQWVTIQCNVDGGNEVSE